MPTEADLNGQHQSVRTNMTSHGLDPTPKERLAGSNPAGDTGRRADSGRLSYPALPLVAFDAVPYEATQLEAAGPALADQCNVKLPRHSELDASLTNVNAAHPHDRP